jgi:6-phosphogluconate dehydrogenase
MQLGMIGLGRMGGNIVRRLMRSGHSTAVYDKDAKAVSGLAGEGAQGATSLEEFVAKLERPRNAWIMLPAGHITETTIDTLAKLMQADDVIIDGGNTFWQDDVRRGKALKDRGIHYVDVGTSGGVWGLDRGYCMMIGGEKTVVDRLDPIFAALAPGAGDIPRTPGREGRDPRIEQGYIHAGPVGAGHFVKMIHNGIEYGLMQAYAEHPEERQDRGAAGRPSFRFRSCRHCRGLAQRQRDPVMVAGSHLHCARRQPGAVEIFRLRGRLR